MRYPKLPHHLKDHDAAKLEKDALQFLWSMQDETRKLHYESDSSRTIVATIRATCDLINHLRGMPPNSMIYPRIGDTRDIGNKRDSE